MQGSMQKVGALMAGHRSLLSSRSVNLQQNAGLKRYMEAKYDLPAKPKRPQTPYLKYLNQVRPNLIKTNPNLKFTEIAKIAGAEWQKLSAPQKKPFEANFKSEWEAYRQAVQKYNSSLTDEQKALIEDAKTEEKEIQAKREIKQQEKEHGKPKKFLSAFLLFSQEIYHKRGSTPQTEWQVKVGEEWRKLDDATKAKYQKKSDALRVEYLNNLKKWEDKMIRMGNLALVRSNVLAANQAKAVASLKDKSVKHMVAKATAAKK